MSVRTAPARRGGPVVARAAQRRRQRRLTVVAVIAVGVAVIAGIVISEGGGGGASSEAIVAMPAPVIATISTVSPATLAQAAATSPAGNAPAPFSSPPLIAGGKPEVLYVGAEYCPFCAAERWAMVAALSQFGHFSRLGATHSSSIDVFPDTQTFSFHGMRYSSPYLTFTAVETRTNVWTGAGYAPLQALTPSQSQLVHTYDFPPYVPDNHAGGIPFIDLGGRFLLEGSSYDPGVLKGLSAAQIGAAVADPASPIAKLVDASAGALTASICALTGGRPAPVCSAFGQT